MIRVKTDELCQHFFEIENFIIDVYEVIKETLPCQW